MLKDDNRKTHLIVTGRGGGGSGTQVQSDWNQTDDTQVDYIKNKPTILTQWFGTQAEYDLIDPKDPNTIYNVEGSDNVQADWNQTDTTAEDYIKNKPTIPAAQVNSDWNSNSGVSQILNKPSLATVATTGNYSDLNGTPTLATVATSGDYDDLQNKPTIPVVPTNVSAFTNDAGYTTFDGDYNSLTNKPTIPAAQVNSDWNSNSGVSQILNKPSLATVATSGNYSDLNGTPSLATVATSGDYDDLQNKPTIPAAPVQSDWNEADSSSLAYIANKPTIPAAQEQSDWNQSDNTQVDYIKNKPNIPTVPAMATQELTFTLQGGTTKTIEFYTVPNYFYVEDVSGADNTLMIRKSNAVAPDVEVFYSTDKANWVSMGTTSTTAITATIPANGKLYLKANTNQWGISQTVYNYINPTVSGKLINVGGNIMSLLYGDNFTNKTEFPLNTNYNFCSLFGNTSPLSSIKSAENLILPATTLTNGCYNMMFRYCTALTQAPVLPATTLANGCYGSMFNNCTALTTPPELPATTLANNCYNAMFRGCTALTTAPAILPATTLSQGCYSAMFQDCTALTTAPAILPATTLTYQCYGGMFDGCRALTVAPELPATTLTNGCYQIMFRDCTNLNSVTTYAQDISASNCLQMWLNNVAATGDFYNLGGATYESGTSGIPSGWTEHTSL